jgi:hypothetical protein
MLPKFAEITKTRDYGVASPVAAMLLMGKGEHWKRKLATWDEIGDTFGRTSRRRRRFCVNEEMFPVLVGPRLH